MKDVEELKSKAATAGVLLITPEDQNDARNQCISDKMIKVKLDVERLIKSGLSMSGWTVGTEANTPLGAVDFFEKRCLHTPTSIPTPLHPPSPTPHPPPTGLKNWSQSTFTSSST